jgi:hypothetical protein
MNFLNWLKKLEFSVYNIFENFSRCTKKAFWGK